MKFFLQQLVSYFLIRATKKSLEDEQLTFFQIHLGYATLFQGFPYTQMIPIPVSIMITKLSRCNIFYKLLTNLFVFFIMFSFDHLIHIEITSLRWQCIYNDEYKKLHLFQHLKL